MDRAERIGLGVAAAGHILLFGILSLGLVSTARLPPPRTEPIDVQLVDLIGLRSAAPTAAPEPPAASEAPDEGPTEDAAPPPSTVPPLPEPTPEPAPKPEPRPAPAKLAPPKPAPPKPVPEKAEPPKPAPKPTPKPEPQPKPEPKPVPPKPKPVPPKPEKDVAAAKAAAEKAAAQKAAAAKAAADKAAAEAKAAEAAEKASAEKAAAAKAKAARDRSAAVKAAVAEATAQGNGAKGSKAKATGSRLGPDFLKGIKAEKATGKAAAPPAAAVSDRAMAGLAAAIKRQVEPCYELGSLQGTDAMQIVTVLRLRFNKDGTTATAPTVTEQTGVDADNRAYAKQIGEVARRAVLRCSPLRLPADLYEGGWEDIELRFTPGQMG